MSLDQLASRGYPRVPSREIEEFAEILVRQVRDAAIRNCDGLLQPNAGSPAGKRWRGTSLEPESLRIFIPDAVDEAIFSLLNAIDQGLLRMKFITSTGREVDLADEGLCELAGWYMGSGGWRAMFSGERFVDDFADLAK